MFTLPENGAIANRFELNMEMAGNKRFEACTKFIETCRMPKLARSFATDYH